MKVTNDGAIPLCTPMEKPFRFETGKMDERVATSVRVAPDEGILGIGSDFI